ncbi:hypothetical protein [Lacisediminihabitans profunda]|uniref:Uncharacterized protein n=1 Tax=Lacisediminihabitans profunda TaxID=2594790 RepID=A0A5C8UQ11_9MICO|nr:hypothetical protein [Lacisediminihabitans profunda]TXN29454.1 hypothetical protein FVP33_14910 [Lacisediminihabitans profunda]
MNWAERALIAFAGLLLTAVVAGAAYADLIRQETFTEGHIPVSLILSQLISQLAPSLTLAGMGILVGLLFARGLRWPTRVDADDADAGARPE